jgi:hypothetical protein
VSPPGMFVFLKVRGGKYPSANFECTISSKSICFAKSGATMN